MVCVGWRTIGSKTQMNDGDFLKDLNTFVTWLCHSSRVIWSTNQLVFVDDGKLFHGSGVGDPFGPRCFEGDIMGCGIMFPRDFCLDGGGEHFIYGLQSTYLIM